MMSDCSCCGRDSAKAPTRGALSVEKAQGWLRLMTNCSWCGYLARLSKGPHVRESKRRESSGLFAAAVEVQLLWARLSKGPHVKGPERREGPGLTEVDVELRLLWARLSTGPT